MRKYNKLHEYIVNMKSLKKASIHQRRFQFDYKVEN